MASPLFAILKSINHTPEDGSPGNTNNPYVGDYFKPSTSSKVELTVQQESIAVLPTIPLPTEYWTRPINAENKEWYALAGNWLWSHNVDGDFNSVTSGPETSHITWNKELTFGGIVGGEYGEGEAYYSGMAYESKFAPPIIISGKLYYNLFGVMAPQPGFVCVDLATGEELWRVSDDRIDLGQIYLYNSPNQHGALAYIWSTETSTWRMYDAFTGTLMVNFTGAQTTLRDSSRNFAYGPNGEILVYLLNSAGRWLAMWNSSYFTGLEAGAWLWRPYQKTLDWSQGIQWNATIPATDVIPANVGIKFVAEDIVLTESYIPPTAEEVYPTFVHASFSASTGEMLWRQTRTDMGWGLGGTGIPGLLWEPANGREGVYVVFRKETLQYYAYNLLKGNQLWETEPLDTFSNTWSYYNWYAQIAYGKLFVTGYSGTIDAFDLDTGDHLWTFTAPSAGHETPYGNYPFYRCITIADGKIYAANNEHSPNTPYWRGLRFYCVNATTGEEIWDIAGWFAQRPTMPVADGYLLGYNVYDNQLYCFGKGPTTVTVSAPSVGISLGSSVVISGTVTDASQGTKRQEQVSRFPHGVAVVSEDSMSGWMEYVYMQKPCPTDVEGVPISIDVLDANGNYRTIGTVTSDAYGAYSFMWTPDIPGKYTVVATFAGSESYWPSYAKTSFGVDEAPEPSVVPTAPASMADLYFMPMSIGIIVAIIVVGLLLFLLLRKR
jgi:outer membrane protein assembly factor BamB